MGIDTELVRETAGSKAMRAAEAGEFLASLLGLNQPLTPQRMWELARARAIPCVRLRRSVLFLSKDLERFVAAQLSAASAVNAIHRDVRK